MIELEFEVPGPGYEIVAEAVVAFFCGRAKALGFADAAGGICQRNGEPESIPAKIKDLGMPARRKASSRRYMGRMEQRLRCRIGLLSRPVWRRQTGHRCWSRIVPSAAILRPLVRLYGNAKTKTGAKAAGST
jgi:hypothetical protein